MKMTIQPARYEDAQQLAWLINISGDGLPAHFWQSIAKPDETPLDVGASRAGRDIGNFSYKNARLCLDQDQEQIMGMIIAYRLADPYDGNSLDEYPDAIQPIIELESKVPGSWYINAIATFEEYKRQGIGEALMTEAESFAREAGCSLLSLIVESDNKAAHNFFEFLGFEDKAAVPTIAFPGCLYGGDWILMVKSLE